MQTILKMSTIEDNNGGYNFFRNGGFSKEILENSLGNPKTGALRTLNSLENPRYGALGEILKIRWKLRDFSINIS